MKINSCIVIGCGGTGGHLVPSLIKLLKYHPHGTTNITVIEGDIFEPHNITRQEGIPTKNKIIHYAQTGKVCTLTQADPQYLGKENIHDIIANVIPPVLIIPAVDNHATRNLLLQKLHELNTDYIWVSPGNEYETYMVSVGRSNAFSSVLDRYEDIKNPIDGLPNSCLAEQVSHPQLLAANMSAASATLSIVTNILDGVPVHQELVGDVRKGKSTGVGLPKILT